MKRITYTTYIFTDGHRAVVTGKWPAWQIKQEEALHGKCISKIKGKI